MDNSPRWDGAYANVTPGPDLPAYSRADLHHVADPSMRPTDLEYDRYIWLVEQLKRCRYDTAVLPQVMDFAVEDVFVSAILSLASGVLADIGEDYDRPAADIAELREWQDRFRVGVAAAVDPDSGLARDRDLRAGTWAETETVAAFAPLLCGGLSREQQRLLLRRFEGPRFCGHPDLRYPVPPSTSPHSADFRPREYWRGPIWPVMTWLFGWAFARRSWPERAYRLRADGLRQAADGAFAEYYEPFSSEPAGQYAAELDRRRGARLAGLTATWLGSGWLRELKSTFETRPG